MAETGYGPNSPSPATLETRPHISDQTGVPLMGTCWLEILIPTLQGKTQNFHCRPLPGAALKFAWPQTPPGTLSEKLIPCSSLGMWTERLAKSAFDRQPGQFSIHIHSVVHVGSHESSAHH